ncbi:RsiV family protein [Clostridioides difficile]
MKDFESINKYQDFYFNKDGNLVISFDEYEVAPGYMGAVEFVIADKVIKRLR